MAEIRAFRALHYDIQQIRDLSKVVTQPYDKISPEMQYRYYGASPYNLARLILGQETAQDTPEDNAYIRAARDFTTWVRSRVLLSEAAPALYPYFQEYEVPGQPGVKKERRGFIGLCRLEEYAAGVVYRHEETLSAPKAGRMELLKRTRAHFGQIFFLYSDPEGKVESILAEQAAGEPWERLDDEYRTRHSVWKITNPSAIQAVEQAMKPKKLVIADGHHRYETALAYRNGRPRESATDYTMATFIRMEAAGLTILPTHRVIRSLPQFDMNQFISASKENFDVEDMPADQVIGEGRKKLETLMAESGQKRPTLAAYAPGKLALLRLRPNLDLACALPGLSEAQRHLDVILLHRLLLEGVLGIGKDAVREEKNIDYVRGLNKALSTVDSGKAQICFLLNPTPIQAVREIALRGEVMPQKSTDFYPKLLSGLTIYWLDNPLGI